MKTDWDVQKIVNWNKMRFPDNTIVLQRRKVEEEISEYAGATTRQKKLEELADVYIAFAGFARFSRVGYFVCEKLFAKLEDFEKLKKAIDNKMSINIHREFDKNMHHIGDYDG